MSNWLAAALANGEQVDDWLAPKRQASLALLRDAKWPSRKTEAWKYTPLFALERADFSQAEPSAQSNVPIDGLASIDVVIIDGQLSPLSAAELPAGLTISSLASASAEVQTWAGALFASVKPERHLFGLVNDVLATDGVVIDVAAGADIKQPVRIVNLCQGGAEVHSRVLVRLGEGAKACVVEQFSATKLGFNTGFAEYDLAAHAELEHYRFALQTGAAMNVGGCHFNLATQAQLNSTLVGFGSQLSRVDMDVNHGGEHTFAKLNAIFLLDGSELFDLHSAIEHAKPNGKTEENIRIIVAGRARAVFNGRIHIHRDAQKVLAELNNRNLLMSRDAEINTKPELEIYADDVRCAHGATIAEIDKKALYYMQSRGLSRSEAQLLLNFGFINELVDQMPNQALAEWLRPQLRERFAQMEVK